MNKENKWNSSCRETERQAVHTQSRKDGRGKGKTKVIYAAAASAPQTPGPVMAAVKL